MTEYVCRKQRRAVNYSIHVCAVCGGETREKKTRNIERANVFLEFGFYVCTVFVDRYLANVAYVYDGGTVTRDTRMKMLILCGCDWLRVTESEVCVCVPL